MGEGWREGARCHPAGFELLGGCAWSLGERCWGAKLAVR